MSTYGYIRVSTGRQADEGHSLEAQTKKILAYATMKDLDTPAIFCDAGVSAAKLPWHDRPQGDALLSRLNRGDHVIISKIDRAFRSTLDAVSILRDWTERGIILHMIDLGIDLSTPQGRFSFTIIAACAELEHGMMRERTMSGLEQARSVGVHLGRAPLGFRHDDAGHLEPVLKPYILALTLLKMREANYPVPTRLALLASHGFRTVGGEIFDKKLLKDTMETVMKNADLIRSWEPHVPVRVALTEEWAVLFRTETGLSIAPNELHGYIDLVSSPPTPGT